MRIASVKLHEVARLEDLHTYDILDTAAENEFDDLAQLAASIYECPSAAITFIDEKRQWFKAVKGCNLYEMPREISFCTHTILQNKVLIVKNTLKDERFRHNPLVTSDPSIRFYAGAPIRSQAGYNLGAVCILDNKPRNLSHLQTQSLEAISRQVSKLLELRLKNKLLEQWANDSISGQKKLLQKTLRLQDKNALAFSTELHENIAQGLAATKFYLDMAEQEPLPFLIKKSKENISRLIEDTRRLSRKLFPTTLRHTGFADLVQQLLYEFELQSGVRTVLSVTGSEMAHHEIALLLYRIIEEQLQNIQLYAKASEVQITLSVDSAIRLQIQDNGVGFDEKKFATGYGINKVVSLSEFYAGSVDIISQPGKGCILDVMIPALQKGKAKPVMASGTQR